MTIPDIRTDAERAWAVRAQDAAPGWKLSALLWDIQVAEMFYRKSDLPDDAKLKALSGLFRDILRRHGIGTLP